MSGFLPPCLVSPTVCPHRPHPDNPSLVIPWSAQQFITCKAAMHVIMGRLDACHPGQTDCITAISGSSMKDTQTRRHTHKEHQSTTTTTSFNILFVSSTTAKLFEIYRRSRLDHWLAWSRQPPQTVCPEQDNESTADLYDTAMITVTNFNDCNMGTICSKLLMYMYTHCHTVQALHKQCFAIFMAVSALDAPITGEYVKRITWYINYMANHSITNVYIDHQLLG